MKNIYLYPIENEITKEAFQIGGLIKYNILGAIEKANDKCMILENEKDKNYDKLDNEKIENADALVVIENDKNILEIASNFLSLNKSIISLKKENKIKYQKSNIFTVFLNNTYLAYRVANKLVRLGYKVNVLSESKMSQLVEIYDTPNIIIVDAEVSALDSSISAPGMVIECEDNIIKRIENHRINNNVKKLTETPIQMKCCEDDIAYRIKSEYLMHSDLRELIKADISAFRKDEISQYNLFNFSEAYFLFEANTRVSYRLNKKVYDFINIYWNHDEVISELYLNPENNDMQNRDFLISSYENFSKIRYNSKLYAKRLEYKIQNQKEWHSGESIISFIGKKACNLSCKYCFMEEKQKDELNREELSEELIRAGLDFILQRKDNAYRVRVDYSLGGEPLLSFDTYKKLWSIVKEYDKREEGEVALGFITNATLLNDEVIDWFNQNHHWIGFSLDGGKK